VAANALISWLTRVALAWSSQNPSALRCVSSSLSCARLPARSKVPPHLGQQLGEAGQFLTYFVGLHPWDYTAY